MANLNQARAGHTATLLADGTVLIASGHDAAGQPLGTAEIYSPATGAYSPVVSSLPAPVGGHTATRLDDGTVLIAGGNGDGGLPISAAQLYDPTTGTFTGLSPMNRPRSQHTATMLADGRVLLAGGTDGLTPLAVLEVYDPAARAFSPAPSSLLVPRQSHTAALLPDRRVLVAGGSNGAAALNSAEIYDPAGGSIALAGPLNVARGGQRRPLAGRHRAGGRRLRPGRPGPRLGRGLPPRPQRFHAPAGADGDGAERSLRRPVAP
jgi:hypothetical protein